MVPGGACRSATGRTAVDKRRRAQPRIRPYVKLGRRYEIEVFGGVNELLGQGVSQAAFLRRAIGLARAGVDGIEIYESEQFCNGDPWRWLAALAGHPDRAERFLNKTSDLEACYSHEA